MIINTLTLVIGWFIQTNVAAVGVVVGAGSVGSTKSVPPYKVVLILCDRLASKLDPTVGRLFNLFTISFGEPPCFIFSFNFHDTSVSFVALKDKALVVYET